MLKPIRNALTVDVEDYFQVSAFADNIKKKDWESYKPRLGENTHKLLDIFSDRRLRATFFVLGWVAEKYPHLIQEIAARGHEVACHGYSHELIYKQTRETFRAETIRAKNTIEDTVQAEVYGYRAASFSITERSIWALDILAESGFLYDSSIFPIRHDRYGISGVSTFPNRMTTPAGQTIIEFPLSTIRFLGYHGYFRLYPYVFTRSALRYINNWLRQPFVFYVHPWELDPDQPRIGGTVLSRFRHYNNLHKCEMRLKLLLNDFEFSAIEDVLTDLNLKIDQHAAP
jgi:polysaccharide deacetylase family protein (PEP-CTERM system associated)